MRAWLLPVLFVAVHSAEEWKRQAELISQTVDLAQKQVRIAKHRRLPVPCEPSSALLHFGNESVVSEQPSLAGSNYCSEYSGRSCCSDTHVSVLISAVAASFNSDAVCDDCRRMALSMICLANCHPRINSGLSAGICPSLARRLFDHCKDDFFERNQQGILIPCSSRNTVCSVLSSITSDPLSFAAQLSFPVDPSQLTCVADLTPEIPPISRRRRHFDGRLSLWTKVTSLFNSLSLWKQGLILSGLVSMLLGCITTQSRSTAGNPEWIRQRRLEALKQRAIAQSSNKEAEIAARLGLAP